MYNEPTSGFSNDLIHLPQFTPFDRTHAEAGVYSNSSPSDFGIFITLKGFNLNNRGLQHTENE